MRAVRLADAPSRSWFSPPMTEAGKGTLADERTRLAVAATNGCLAFGVISSPCVRCGRVKTPRQEVALRRACAALRGALLRA